MASKDSLDGRRVPARRDPDSPAFYLRELGDRVPPGPEEELEWANRIREARERIAELVLAVPEEYREFAAGPSPPRPGKRWPLEHLESCVERLARLAPACSDPETAERLRRIATEKKRLDRARDALVLANLRFVPHVARRFNGCGLPFMDLVQEGNLGLIKAVDRFEPERGLRFCTYAFWWIRQSITKAIGDKSRLVRLPAQIGASLTRLRQARKELIERLGRKPTAAELAKRMKVSLERLEDLLAVAREARPLEELERPPGAGRDAESSGGAASPLEEALDREVRREVVQALGRLSRREEEVLRLRYGLGRDRAHTLREIGVMFGISRERIRQIELEALAKLPVQHLRALQGSRGASRESSRLPRRRRPRGGPRGGQAGKRGPRTTPGASLP
jgi:RNA polymerase sigma factor (sigma-70 family)